jgi:DnaJ-class molecular chaperone
VSRAAALSRHRSGGVARRRGASPDRGGHSQTLLDEELARFGRPTSDSDRREERSRPGGACVQAEAGGGRLTLGELVAGAWEGLHAAGSAPCPVCDGEMERRGGVGRCGECGSTLA